MNRYFFKFIVMAGLLSAVAVGCGDSSNTVEMPANPEPAPGAPTGAGASAGEKSPGP